MPPGEIHGSRSTYVNRRCRCPLCREANAADARARRQAAEPPPVEEPDREPDLYDALGTLPPVT